MPSSVASRASGASPAVGDTAFTWQDDSRFVSVRRVACGWLVLWGRWHDTGRRRELAGSRTYLDLEGARRRLADSVLELTGNPALVTEAVVRFDRGQFAASPANSGNDEPAGRAPGAEIAGS